MSVQTDISLNKLLKQVADDQDNQTMQEVYATYDELTQQHPTDLEEMLKSSLEQVLGSLLDPVFVPKRDEFAQGLKKAYQRVQKDGRTRNLGNLQGAIGLVCFMLELMDIAEQQSRTSSLLKLDSPQTLLNDQNVRYWFMQVYTPDPKSLASLQNSSRKTDEEENLKAAIEYWRKLDPDSLVLHRVGTTSFILRCRIYNIPSIEKQVFKCLLFPYTRDLEVTEATRRYALQYDVNRISKVSTITPVFSSTDRWILMKFVEGSTLREYLEEYKQRESQKPPLLRTKWLKSIGMPLLAALTELFQEGLRHEDLTPSNIMVREKPDGSIEIALIDLGRNYLYTRRLGLEANREAQFVAPELKDSKSPRYDTSDLYSFGMILIELADPVGVQGRTVPDSLHQYAPHLARFVEDLIDQNPEYRLLIFRSHDRKDPYSNLYNIFADILKVLPSQPEVNPGRFFRVRQFIGLFYPSHQLAHARDLWNITRKSSAPIAKYTGRLYWWLMISMISSWLMLTVCVLWGARDLGQNLFPTPISIAQTLIPGCGGTCVPLLDMLQAPDYVFSIQSLPVRLVDLSAVLVVSAHYIYILAGLTTRPMNNRLAYVTGFFLRFETVGLLPLALIGNLYEPGWWLGLLIVGALVPILTNVLCYQLATRTLREARGVFSTVPQLDDPFLKTLAQWVTSSFFYFLALLAVCIGIYMQFLHDTWAYVIGILVANVFIACISKSIIFAPNIRGSLNRAFTLGERLEEVKP
jgi:serine/threonine protein kinase